MRQHPSLALSSDFLLVCGVDVDGTSLDARTAKFVCEKCGERTQREMMLECGRTVALCPLCRETFFALLDRHLRDSVFQRLTSDGLKGLADLVELRDGEEERGVSKRVFVHAASFRCAGLSLSSPVASSRPPPLSVDVMSAVSSPVEEGSPGPARLKPWAKPCSLARSAFGAVTEEQHAPPLLGPNPALAVRFEAACSPFPGVPRMPAGSMVLLDSLHRDVSSSHATLPLGQVHTRHGKPRMRPRTVMGGIEAVGRTASAEPQRFSLPSLTVSGRRSVSPTVSRRRGAECEGGGERLREGVQQRGRVMSRQELERAGRDVRRALRVVFSSV